MLPTGPEYMNHYVSIVKIMSVFMISAALEEEKTLNLLQLKIFFLETLSGRVQDHAISASRVKLTAGRRRAALGGLPPARRRHPPASQTPLWVG